MAWQMTGTWINACSCKAMCPCFLGPAEPDRGWCSGADIYDIQQGSSDGVDLSGCKVASDLDLPGDFYSGNGTQRIYIDEAATPDQRRELEAIFKGEKGGAFEALAAAISNRLSTQVAKIDLRSGDNPSATVGSVGRVNVERIKTEDGRQAKLQDAPALAPFGIQSGDLALSGGTRWSDPDLRLWESDGRGSAVIMSFNWSA